MSTVTVQKNPMFNLAYEYVVQTNKHIFLTGKAGTGKTTFLKYLLEHCPKNCVVAAPTGVAAMNAGGVTLHSLFMLPLSPYVPEPLPKFTESNVLDKQHLTQNVRYDKNKLKLLRSMDILVIDEVSMLRVDTLDAIDVLLRFARRNNAQAFGGVQVLFIGDLFQLPPVAPNAEWAVLQQYYKSEYFFDSRVMQEAKPVCVELDKIYRQTDATFIDLLNAVRSNNVSGTNLQLLNSHYNPRPTDKDGIILTTHNKQAQTINEKNLANLPGKTYKFDAEISGDINVNSLSVDTELLLKNGARVMFLKNDVSGNKQYYNGKIGRVIDLDNDSITVRCDGETEDILVRKDEWKNIKYKLELEKEKIQEHVVGSVSQYPLRLAWAVTIHKSQGLTFDKCVIEAEQCFASGQLYVALSRCRTLEGVTLLSQVPANAAITDRRIVAYYNNMQVEQVTASLTTAQQAYLQTLLTQLYDYNKPFTLLVEIGAGIKAFSKDFNTDAYSTLEKLQQLLQHLKQTGDNFIRELEIIFADTNTATQQQKLNDRVTKANNYYTTKLTELLQAIQQHQLVTDSKQLSAEVDAKLLSIIAELSTYVQYRQVVHGNITSDMFLSKRQEIIYPPLQQSTYALKQKSYGASKSNHPDLYSALLSLRDDYCDTEAVPIYMVANQECLMQMCTYLPSTPKDLLLIKGMGEAKVRKYGDGFLGAILQYLRKHNLQSNMAELSTTTKKASKGPKDPKVGTAKKPLSYSITLELWKNGLRAEQIAEHRKLAISTVNEHLVECITNNHLNLIDVIDGVKGLELLQLIADNMQLSLSELRIKSNDKFSFNELRLAKAQAVRNSEITQ